MIKDTIGFYCGVGLKGEDGYYSIRYNHDLCISPSGSMNSSLMRYMINNQFKDDLACELRLQQLKSIEPEDIEHITVFAIYDFDSHKYLYNVIGDDYYGIR